MAPLSGLLVAPLPGLLPVLFHVLTTDITLPRIQAAASGLQVKHF